MGERQRKQPNAGVCAAVHQRYECNRRDRPAKLQRRLTQPSSRPDIGDAEQPSGRRHRTAALLTVRFRLMESRAKSLLGGSFEIASLPEASDDPSLRTWAPW